MPTRKYPYEHKGHPTSARALERELPDAALREEIAAAEGNPERKDWLRKLRAEARRRGIL